MLLLKRSELVGGYTSQSIPLWLLRKKYGSRLKTLYSKKCGFNFQSKYSMQKNAWLQPSKCPSQRYIDTIWYLSIYIVHSRYLSVYLGYFVTSIFCTKMPQFLHHRPSSHQCHWQSPPRSPKGGAMDWPQNSKDLRPCCHMAWYFKVDDIQI